MMYETKEKKMKKQFSIRKDLGTQIQYKTISGINAAIPKVRKGQIVHVDEYDKEWCTLFDKKLIDIHIGQLV